jgi:hypothetical protein
MVSASPMRFAMSYLHPLGPVVCQHNGVNNAVLAEVPVVPGIVLGNDNLNSQHHMALPIMYFASES